MMSRKDQNRVYYLSESLLLMEGGAVWVVNNYLFPPFDWNRRSIFFRENNLNEITRVRRVYSKGFITASSFRVQVQDIMCVYI